MPSAWVSRPGARGVVVRQAQQNEVGMVSLPCSFAAIQAFRCLQKNFDPDLVGHKKIEIRRFRGEVAHQFRLGGDIAGHQRNRPGPFVDAAAPLGGQRLAGRDGLARAVAALAARAPAADWRSSPSSQKVDEMYSPKW